MTQATIPVSSIDIMNPRFPQILMPEGKTPPQIRCPGLGTSDVKVNRFLQSA
jgi:hypothetical protein